LGAGDLSVGSALVHVCRGRPAAIRYIAEERSAVRETKRPERSQHRVLE
jgi:hypothetical protein